MSAKLLVVVMGMAWGFNWVAARFILEALPPWTMRTIGIGLGDLTLFAAAAISGATLAVPRGERSKILIAGFFNVAVFSVGSAYAQVYGTTSRAIVIAYSMPIWSALLAHFVLKEKLNAAETFRVGAMRHRLDDPDLLRWRAPAFRLARCSHLAAPGVGPPAPSISNGRKSARPL